MENKKRNSVATVLLTIVCILWMYPIVLILINSLKKEVAITTSGVFSLPTSETWNGVANFVASVTQMDFLKSFWYSLVISVMSVALIMLCCSMAAWYIVRVNGKLSKIFYYLCVFSMVVPFQMVMFTLAKTADTLHLNNPYNICIIYLGFGAGLAVFMFTGFVKGIPLEIEEAALIDGCSPLQVFFKVLIPILKPTIISTAILELMWVWNDYLLPTLVLDIKKYKTIPMAVQYFRGSFGHVQMGPMMASIMIDIIPNNTQYSAMYIKFVFSNVIQELFQENQFSGERRLEHEIERLYNCRNIMEIVEVTEDNIKEYEAFLDRSMSSSRNEVAAVKNYIYQHYEEDLNLEMLAEKVYLSSGYLSFIFKKETGMNLNRYIRVFRMEKAKELLCSTNMKVAQVSERVGFANVSYFCRSFREYYGSSPESYRKGTGEDEQTS